MTRAVPAHPPTVPSPPAPDPSQRSCPRCGYDQRGAMATWTDSCPLESTCTECGFAIEWAELLGPQRRRPAWCVEYGRRRALPRRVALTLVRTFWPPAFWGSLRASHPIRGWRLAAYLGAIAAVAYVAFALAHGALVADRWSQPWVWNGVNWVTGPPATPLDVLQAVVLPWSEARPPPLVRGGRVWAQADSSRELLHLWGAIAWRLGPLLALHLAAAATFACLPVSRRRAKVRWAHVGRITAYGAALALPVVLAWIVAVPIDVRRRSFLEGPVELASTALLWLYPVLVLLWWWAATRQYLRMPHAFGVALAAWIIGVLVASIWTLRVLFR